MTRIDDERQEEKREIEINDAQVNVSKWVQDLEHTVTGLERGYLQTFLEVHGANFKELTISEQEKFHAKHYSNPSRSNGMQAVWGDKYSQYKAWCEDYVAVYESRTGKVLPQVRFPSGNTSKTEGMRGFFADLTAYAATNDFEFSNEDFTNRVKARVRNGQLRESGITDKESRAKIVVTGYDNNDPFAPAGFPPEFPQKALALIESWK